MPRLSLCIMARNEEATIGRAIASFEALADEVVVVDTGSQDGTREAAAARGARVVEFPWPESFAEVRNFMYAQATGTWIFHLDADEALLATSQRKLRALLERDDLLAAYVLRQDLRDEANLADGTEMWQLRLFRREGLSPMKGRCHPQFEPSLEALAASRGLRVDHSDVRLRHWGYLGPMRRAKLERGARLLRLELSERPGRLYYLAELAQTLDDLEDPDAHAIRAEAWRVLSDLRDRGETPDTGALVLIESQLGRADLALPEGWSEAEMAEYGLQWFPDSVPLLWQWARRAFVQGEASVARERLERVAALARSGRYDRTISFDPAILGDELWLNLGVCRWECGDAPGAAECFRRIPPGSSFYDSARRNLDLLTRSAAS